MSQAPRARNLDWVPRRLTTHASRPPPTMVRPHPKHGDAPLRARGQVGAKKSRVHSRAAPPSSNEESSTPGASACSDVGFQTSLPCTCGLTVKLRRRPTTCPRRGGPAISTGSRRAQPPTPHGPLQRLLDSSWSALVIRISPAPARRRALQIADDELHGDQDADIRQIHPTAFRSKQPRRWR